MTLPVISRPRHLPFALLLLGCGLGAVSLPAWAAEAETIRLTAKPNTLFADGTTFTTITAEARDRSGRLVGDGEVVHFSTTLGTIESSKVTQGGQATVHLTSATTPGTANVTATSGHATSDVKVVFSNQPLSVQDENPRAIVVRAKYLLYNQLESVLDAVDDVHISIGDMEIKADRAQIDFTRSKVVAQSQAGASSLIVSRGKARYAVDKLYYSWDSRAGMMSGLEDPVRGLYSLDGNTMAVTKAVATAGSLADPDMFDLRELDPSPLAIKSSRVIFIPGDEMQFSHAEIMLNGKKRFGIPYHVIPLGSSRYASAQYVGLGERGPLLDLPYYVAAGVLGSSQLRLKFNAPEGLYGANVKGWALDLLNKYAFSKNTNGTLMVTRMTSPDWGVTWAHNQDLGPTTKAYFNLDTRRYLSYLTTTATTGTGGTGTGGTGGTGDGTPSPYVEGYQRYTIGNFSVSHQAKAFSLNVSGYGSRIKRTTGDLAASIQSAAHLLGTSGFSWSVGGTATQSWRASSVTDPNAVITKSSSTGVNGRINTPVVRLAGFTMNGSLGSGLTYSSGVRRSLLGTITASHPLGRGGALNLTYNYNDLGLSSDMAFLGIDKQTMTASVTYGKYPKWSTSAFATLGLEQHRQNVRFVSQYIFDPKWDLRVSASYFHQGAETFTLPIDLPDNVVVRNAFQVVNLEVRLTRSLGERALALVYDSYGNKVYLDYTPGANF